MNKTIVLFAVVLLAAVGYQSISTQTPAQPAVRRALLELTAPDMPVSASIERSNPAYTLKVNLDAFAPPGSGRDLVIMNCDNCHSWVCSVQGQRNLNHWKSVEYVHRKTSLVILSDHDWDTLFSYLEDNFNDRKPEPQLPPAYSEVSCDYEALY